ncbi:SURF1 family protein [Gephyromycinifex aptenodytis]|uniref:SURF1 family protein n=1 Tax=Gephyromycinifex aptenodytis TaxID=2716227 RepID=UPI0014465F2E|nr:SURF1 family protein [Gephyromycinifex aptenodytis]
MLRTALQPRWLALLGLVLVVVVTFGWLGMWQLDVSRSKGQREMLAQIEAAPAEPVQDIITPHAPFTGNMVGRKVTATGSYDPAGQVLIARRRLGEQVGFWVLTPLIVDDGGARLPIVRGFTPTDSAPPPPPGTIKVQGALQPQEGPPDDPSPLPTGQLGSVDLSSLVNVWPGDLYNGFVFATDEDPAPEDIRAGTLQRIPLPVSGSEGIVWRNFAYAIQWWIFAAFALYLWWRMVRDDYEVSQLPTQDTPAAAPPADHAPEDIQSSTAGGQPS